MLLRNSYAFYEFFLIIVTGFPPAENQQDCSKQQPLSLSSSKLEEKIRFNFSLYFAMNIKRRNPFSAKPTKWSITLKQFVLGIKALQNFVETHRQRQI